MDSCYLFLNYFCWGWLIGVVVVVMSFGVGVVFLVVVEIIVDGLLCDNVLFDILILEVVYGVFVVIDLVW